MLSFCDTYPVVQVVEIAPVAESTGKVMVIDGAGACPREDASGSHVWVEDLRKLRSGTVPERNDVLSEIACALNYKGTPVTVDFDPDNFDLVRARQRVHEALASPDSVWSGPKSFVHPLREETLTQPPPGVLKKGQTLERTWEGRLGTWLTQVYRRGEEIVP